MRTKWWWQRKGKEGNNVTTKASQERDQAWKAENTSVKENTISSEVSLSLKLFHLSHLLSFCIFSSLAWNHFYSCFYQISVWPSSQFSKTDRPKRLLCPSLMVPCDALSIHIVLIISLLYDFQVDQKPQNRDLAFKLIFLSSATL